MFLGIRQGSSYPGLPRGDRGSGGETRPDTPSIPGHQATPTRKSVRVRRGFKLPRTRTPKSREAQDARAYGSGARRASDSRVPVRAGRSGPSGARTPQGSPEELRRPEGRTPGSPGSQRSAPPGRAGASRSEAKSERSTAGPRPPCGPRPCSPPGAAPPRPVPVGVPDRPPQPGTARRFLFAAPQWRWPAALRPAPTRPIERATRLRLASRAPSHRGGAPWRPRPLLQVCPPLQGSQVLGLKR
ncbi:uncharacterized protein LOC114898051 [Monodon monoceros]|uniref:uncharacterized protein LOC114898051 n=1 Tax=Monodon monoceros TaxID=40151 RepID=UPI0010F5BB28|nr:uncharacterized protein LOC114898051 [Monodon monoceros]